MPRTSRLTRARILDAAYGLFYRRGYARVGVDAVAARARVTKRTLYNHFGSKDALLAAMLERQHALALARIAEWGNGLPRGAGAMIDRLFAELAGWAAQPHWTGAGFTRLALELADLPGHPARAMARRHKQAIEAWLAAELARRQVATAAACARQIVMLLEGCQVMMLVSGDRGYAEDAARAAKRLVAPAR